VLVVAIAWRTRTGGPAKSGPAAPHLAPPGWWIRTLWVALPATASILLLAITTYLTQDVAAIPFLWILPLSAYLLSFVICFETPRLYYRAVFLPLLAAALGTVAYMLWVGRNEFTAGAGVALATGALFVICMVCHGELVGLKPNPRYLTAFYLMLSLLAARSAGYLWDWWRPACSAAFSNFPSGWRFAPR
jgi:hypothetical protein